MPRDIPPEESLGTALDGSFPAEVAAALRGGGLDTVEDLYECMAGLGGSWYLAFPGITPGDAVELADWLASEAPGVGEVTAAFYPPDTAGPAGSTCFPHEKEQAGPAAAAPAGEGSPLNSVSLPAHSGTAPALRLPEELSGTSGSNRGEDNSLDADDDAAAIERWLQARAANANTLSAYRREAERFLLWCTMERGRALSSANSEDAALYLRWLEELGRTDPHEWAGRWRISQDSWIGPRNAERLSAGWRPFSGPLAHTSRHAAVTAVKLLFNFLVRTGYLRHNPFEQVSTKVRYLPGEGLPKQYADRSLTESQWREVLDFLGSMEDGPAKARMRLVLTLGKVLGMRASEMINARAGWISMHRVGGEDMLMIEITGKGDKVRRLPFPPDAVDAVNDYFQWRGLPSLMDADPAASLIVSANRGQISRSGLYTILTCFFESAAAEAERRSPADAAKLRAGSTHWLRHTFAVNALKSMDINMVQTALGHASVSTTTLYLTPEEAELARAFRKVDKL